jgi:hypothetical protein
MILEEDFLTQAFLQRSQGYACLVGVVFHLFHCMLRRMPNP